MADDQTGTQPPTGGPDAPPEEPPAGPEQPPLGPSEHGGFPFTRNIPLHVKRTDSPDYVRSRAKMHDLVDTVTDFFYGQEPYEDHHGGGLWLKDADGWFMLRNLAGIEWSAQFCADPAKVDKLRINAKRLYDAFPDAVDELEIRDLLDTPIIDSAGIAKWTDSICNASVPLPKEDHTGVLPPIAGMHGYPSPVAEIQLFKWDWFDLWHFSEQTQEVVAATPMGFLGEGDGRTRAIFAAPVVPGEGGIDSSGFLGEQGAQPEDGDLILPADHPFSQQAFANQPENG
jgi:uncharacterized protein DUF6424